MDASTGSADLSFPRIEQRAGSVSAVVPDGNGGWYVGGGFEVVDGAFQANRNLIHVTASNTVDGAFAVSFSSTSRVSTLAYDAGANILFIGGEFRDVNGVSVNAVAAVDGTTGDLVSGWDAGLPGGSNVESLLLDGSDLYLGGTFDEVGGQTRVNLAKVRAADGSLDSAFDTESVFAANRGIVFALARDSGALYVGGSFGNGGSGSRRNIAAVDPSTGDLLPWYPSGGTTNNAEVNALAVAGDTVYVGGDFQDIGGESRAGLAAVGASGTAPADTVTAWNADLQEVTPNLPPQVFTLATGANTLYIGGVFTSVGDSIRVNCTEVNLGDGRATAFEGSVVRGGGFGSGAVEALALQAGNQGTDRLLAGGAFQFIGGKRRYNLAAFDASGALLDSWRAGVKVSTISGLPPLRSFTDAHVKDFEVDDDIVYVGGRFDQAFSAPGAAVGDRENLAAFGAFGGRVEAWVPDADGEVEAVAIDRPGEIIYVGGNFSKVGIPIGQLGQPARDNLAGIAPVDPTGNATAGEAFPFDPDPNGTVHAIALDPDTTGRDIFVAGTFSAFRVGDGANETEIARDDIGKLGPSGNLLDWHLPGGVGGIVYDIEPAGGSLFVSGDFSVIGGESRDGIADLSPAADASSGEATVASWNPDLKFGAFSSPIVFDLEHSTVNNAVYAATDASAGNLVSIDAFSAQVNVPVALGGSANAVAIKEPTVYVGGEFVISPPNQTPGDPLALNFAGFEDGTLPVELAGFTAGHDSERVVLSWTTASETNNAGFDVQRSVDDSAFETIGFREGAGTTTEAQFYRFIDSDLPFEATSVQYRLRQRDLDGTTSLSAVQTVTLAAPQQVALLPPFPNPSLGQTTVRYQLPENGTVKLALYNVLGQRVATLVRGKQAAGNRQITVDTSTLGSGVYFVRLLARGQAMTEKITVVK